MLVSPAQLPLEQNFGAQRAVKFSADVDIVYYIFFCPPLPFHVAACDIRKSVQLKWAASADSEKEATSQNPFDSGNNDLKRKKSSPRQLQK